MKYLQGFIQILTIINLILVININALRKNFTTCDFDLEPIEDYIEHLPELCQNIYKDSSLLEVKEKATTESNLYKEYWKKLSDYEEKNNNGKEEYKLRFEIYNKTEIWICDTKEIINEYFNCLIDIRKNMITELDNQINPK
ncbi:uncharacterized protein LOC129615620 [Condylostylus longicornis]|uniref:uncharacterized protein LOC129615620 n=1 Tax=Condylostylus longicornis TaxID=2530218 RepID=UPI00244DE2C0|nr:uncharacterized protein LOC129615620 [Condylostylus longicornis]